jgi:hypothetical protein
VSFHIEDKLVNTIQLKRLQVCASNKKLQDYLETNVVPLITKKIKYTKFARQFRFFLSHKAKDKPVMRTFEAGLTFLGYSTWIDESNMPMAKAGCRYAPIMGAYLQPALKTSIDDCDCFVEQGIFHKRVLYSRALIRQNSW